MPSTRLTQNKRTVWQPGIRKQSYILNADCYVVEKCV